MVLVEMWIAKAYKRELRIPQVAAMAKIAFWSLLVYQAVRVADVAVRGQLAAELSGPKGGLFIAEIVLGGVLPLVILGAAKLRQQPVTLFLGAFLAAGGIVFNRVNVVFFGMNLKGAMPQVAPESYSPSMVEWGISLGLIAATIFLFGLGVRLMPVLPKEEPSHR
jgi:formate dehydrogenase iron-sulfur subunit